MFERPSDEVIRELSRALRQALGVSLFGIDIIINNQTGQHAVIDVNAFPGEQQGKVTLRWWLPGVFSGWEVSQLDWRWESPSSFCSLEQVLSFCSLGS